MAYSPTIDGLFGDQASNLMSRRSFTGRIEKQDVIMGVTDEVHRSTVKYASGLMVNINLTNESFTGPPEYDVTVGDIFVGLVLGILISAIIFGNGLVLISVALFKRMRTPSTLLIASLASADFLVAIMVLPISLYHELTKLWMLGPVICDYWITCDVFFCTASMLNVCIIALDRYFKITKNVDYTHNKTLARPKVCIIMVATAWVLSLLIATTPLLGWNQGTEKQQAYECIISQDLGYTIFSTFGAFYIPMVALVVVYCRIYKFAVLRLQKRTKEMRRKRSSMMAMLSQDTGNGNGSPQSSLALKRKSTDSVDRSKRSAKMLGVIIGCFVCCWLPFFLLASITPFCKDCAVPKLISSIALWLGYFNSFCNPCIYAVWNKQYRDSFICLLKCDLRGRHSTNRFSCRGYKFTQSKLDGVKTQDAVENCSVNQSSRRASVMLTNLPSYIPDKSNSTARSTHACKNGFLCPPSRNGFEKSASNLSAKAPETESNNNSNTPLNK